MTFKSYSQASQDLFVHAVLPTTNGTYIEIGGSHPIDLSNTYALEQLGWRGVSVDIDANAVALHHKLRKNPAWCADATKIAWDVRMAQIEPTLGSRIGYASVDIDEWTHNALRNLIHYFQPTVLTVEHDQYSRGDRLRIPNRELLIDHGYVLVAADVHSNGCSFEDWFVHPAFVDRRLWGPFMSVGLDHADVMRKGGVL